MALLQNEVWPFVLQIPTVRDAIQELHQRLGDVHFNSLRNALLRHVFLIEALASKNTKICSRWSENLQNISPQRWCSFEECLELFGSLVNDLPRWLETPQHAELLSLFFNNSIISYEVPLDYLDVPAKTDNDTRIHRIGNLRWTFDERMLRTLKLRAFLTNPATSPDETFFSKVLKDKIKTKTYLTDRAQVGDFKTNREKRWEADPHSPQFATRTETMAIEYALITQLCAFEGFPTASLESLQALGVIPNELPILRCPITLEPMSFLEFREALLNPQHGRSDFQVGHLNPLKLEIEANETTAEAVGHTSNNISWISADGNRIQGSLSLDSVQELLRKIARNYQSLSIL